MDKITNIERKYRLKYRYFIDIDSVIANIVNSPEYIAYKTDETSYDNISLILNKIFLDILNNSLEYNSYIFPSSTHYQSFFSPKFAPIYDSPINTHLLYLTFFHHCILQGLFHSLENCKTEDKSDIKITFANETDLNVGYFSSKPIDIKMSSTMSEYNNKHAKYTQKYERINPNHYSIQLLSKIDSMEQININDFDHGKNVKGKRTKKTFYVPTYMKNAAFALFTSTQINTLNRNILDNSPNTLKNYISLYELFINSIKATKIEYNKSSDTDKYPKYYLNNNTDKLLYTAPMEYFYGFSTINSICKLLDMLSSIHTELENMQYLKGKLFNDIAIKLFQCPMVYSRHFLLNYATLSITKSNYLYSTYLERKPYDFGKKIPPEYETNSTNIVTKGLPYIQKFFDIINNITLPILEDMWNTCIDELINSNQIEFYKIYLDTNIDYITYDYSNLLDFSSSIHFFNSNMYDKFSQNRCCGNKPTVESIKLFYNTINTKDSNKVFYLSNLNKNSDTYKTLNDILLSALKFEHIFGTNIPINNQMYTIDGNARKDLYYLKFFLSHRNNLINFYNEMCNN